MSKLEALFKQELEEIRDRRIRNRQRKSEAEGRIKSDEEIVLACDQADEDMEKEELAIESRLEAYQEDLAVMRHSAKMMYTAVASMNNVTEAAEAVKSFLDGIGIEIEEVAEENESPPDEEDPSLAAVGT